MLWRRHCARPTTDSRGCVCVRGSVGSVNSWGKKQQKSENHILKNEDSKRIKEWFKVHERKVQQSMQWDSVVCAKKWLHSIGVACRISMLDCGCLKEFCWQVGPTHPELERWRQGQRKPPLLSFNTSFFIFFEQTHNNLMYSYWTDTHSTLLTSYTLNRHTHTLPALHHIEETHTAET